MQRGQTAHREPADVRPGDAERVEQALDVVGGLLLRVRFWILGHVGRRIAAGVERERTVAPREERPLQPPALRIAGELVDEHQRGALARLVIVELHASDRHFRHGHTSLVLRLASDGGAPAPRRPAARTTVLRLASDGGAPAPRRPAARTTVLRLASDGGAPAPRRPAARTTMIVCARASRGPPCSPAAPPRRRPAAPARSPPRSPRRPTCWPGRRCARIASTVAAASAAAAGRRRPTPRARRRPR